MSSFPFLSSFVVSFISFDCLCVFAPYLLHCLVLFRVFCVVLCWSCVVLSRLVLSRGAILSGDCCAILSGDCFVLDCLTLYRLVWTRLVMSGLVLSCRVLSV
jgi:hypothetical protein